MQRADFHLIWCIKRIGYEENLQKFQVVFIDQHGFYTHGK